MLNGVNLGHDVGYLEDAMTGCLELVAFCDEVIGWLRRYLRKLEISEETLALDLIHQVGPDGDFIQARHTLQHVREDWMPTLMDRNNYSRWMEKGGTILQERAKGKVREIVEEHRAPRLPAAVVQVLDEIVQR
jgi:trimethylamine--corrinoid protein Co-methyltransferase